MKKIFYISLYILLIGCLDKKSCKNAICTEVFSMVTVKINIPWSIPVSEISTQTVLLSSPHVIHVQTAPSGSQNNVFTIVDDSDLQELGFKSNQTVEFKILRNGTVISSSQFVIITDCCHVTKIEGPEQINL